MFLKLGDTHTVAIVISDINGNRVTNDSPYTLIKDKENNLYWNGIEWVNNEFRIYLNHVLNGVYQFSFIPDKPGHYEIVSMSEIYSSSKLETVEVYDEDFAAYEWATGHEFIIKCTSKETQPTVTILNTETGQYLGKDNWTNDQVILDMDKLEGDIFIRSFTPNTIGKFHITITNDLSSTLLVLNVGDSAEVISPVVVSNLSVKSTNGTDTTVISDSGIPMSNVKVLAYNQSGKELISKTITDESGAWNMLLRPGMYYFMFEKDGYTPIGMQRTVV